MGRFGILVHGRTLEELLVAMTERYTKVTMCATGNLQTKRLGVKALLGWRYLVARTANRCQSSWETTGLILSHSVSKWRHIYIYGCVEFPLARLYFSLHPTYDATSSSSFGT